MISFLASGLHGTTDALQARHEQCAAASSMPLQDLRSSSGAIQALTSHSLVQFAESHAIDLTNGDASVAGAEPNKLTGPQSTLASTVAAINRFLDQLANGDFAKKGAPGLPAPVQACS